MYKQLTSEQRYTISRLHEQCMSGKYIAMVIGVSASSVSRELRRNSKRGKYDGGWAQRRAAERRHRSYASRRISKDVWKLVLHFLIEKQWSPQQISCFLAKNGIKISHETIYARIRADKRNRGTLYMHLRHKLKHRKRPVSANNARITNKKSIHDRPPEADGTRFGDLEMDTIAGQNHQQVILTIIDRSTNMLFMRKLKHGYNAVELAKVVIQILKPIKAHLHTITTDNGTEFAAHQMITKELGVDVYFADPYAPWQKGAVENANGLIRQYIPKGTSFKELTDSDITLIQNKINRRPRQKLNYQTPLACFIQNIY